MPRFMPNERHAACSSFGRAHRTGPTSQAAANNSAVLARITAMYSSSVVAVFLATASCITSPSAITAAADGENFQRLEAADLDHHLERLAEQEIADQHACLVAPQHARGEPAAPHLAFVDHVVVQQRRRVHELDRGRELDVAVAAIAGEPRQRQVSIGRSRLPPELIRWLATSGIIVTSEPVRVRMTLLTRSMSARNEVEQRIDRGLIGTFETGRRQPRNILHSRTREHRNAMVTRQVRLPGVALQCGGVLLLGRRRRRSSLSSDAVRGGRT